MVMQNLGVNKAHYGLCENAQCPFRTFTTKNPAFLIFLFSLRCAEYKHLQHTRTTVADLFFS